MICTYDTFIDIDLHIEIENKTRYSLKIVYTSFDLLYGFNFKLILWTLIGLNGLVGLNGPELNGLNGFCSHALPQREFRGPGHHNLPLPSGMRPPTGKNNRRMRAGMQLL